MTLRMTDTPEKVEVITSVQQRRGWSAAEKMRMVEESQEPGASVSLVARRHGVRARASAASFRRRATLAECQRQAAERVRALRAELAAAAR